MAKELAIGFYLQRHAIFTLVSRVDRSGDYWPHLEFQAWDVAQWTGRSRKDTIANLNYIGATVAEKYKSETQSVGIASYGPFLSLDRSSEFYGELHPETPHLPLRGINLRRELYEPIAKGINSKPHLIIHTDANACALGQAYLRKSKPDDLLVYILATEGIGGGVVSGRRILASALHPEMGLIHARFDTDDILKPREKDRLFSKSIAEFAANPAMRERFKAKNGNQSITDEAASLFKDGSVWDLRGYYIAQLCLAVTGILSPHRIIVAADLEPDDSTSNHQIDYYTRKYFELFLKNRRDNNQPVFQYRELEKIDETSGFITSPIQPRLFQVEEMNDIFSTVRGAELMMGGAIGMCAGASLEIGTAKTLTSIGNKMR